MIEPPFDELHFKKQSSRTIKGKKDIKIAGFDTETANGLAHLICDSHGRYINPCSFDDCLHFLCCDSTRGFTSFFFNLKYDFQAILKWLPAEYWEIIYHTGKIDYVSDGKKYEITYIPKKLLSIKCKRGKKSEKWSFYDIAQFFHMSLENAAQKYLGMGKQKHKYDLSKLEMHHFTEFDMITYCQRDAVLTQMLAEYWVKICHDGGLYPSNFCSPASIASQYFKAKVKIPAINPFFEDDNKPLLKIAWESVSGAFISCYKRGFFPEVHEYDINSAYPAGIAELPDLSKGRFFYSKGKPTKNALLGWMKCRVTIMPGDRGDYCPCIPIQRENLPNYYPLGVFETNITLLEFLEFSKFWDIKPIEGVYFCSDNPTYLYREIVNDLYNTRQLTTDENVNMFIKTILNGYYGKHLEKHPDRDENSKTFGKSITGSLFNPFYGSYILAQARLKAFDLMSRIEPEKIVACFTDSVFTTEELTWLPTSKKLGDWGYVQKGEMVILGCGVYTVKGEKKTKSRLRGFHSTEKDDSNLFKLIEKNPESDALSVNITLNLSPLSCIISHKEEDMNLIVDSTKTVKLNFDTKRIWHGNFKTAGEFLAKQVDSSPFIQM